MKTRSIVATSLLPFLAAAACSSLDAGNGENVDQTSDALSDSAASGNIASSHDLQTTTPIKHVVVIVGENRTFDHVFATYKPKHNQKISNLLSKKIIDENGNPGPNFGSVEQRSAVDSQPSGYDVSPGSQVPYETLPPPRVGGPTTSYLPDAATAAEVEYDLPADYMQYLLTGGTGLTSGVVDTRIPNVSSLPPGPFPITPAIPYDAYTGDPVHRFYQMWQELDCSAKHATKDNPSGCLQRLFPWVEATISTGTNGSPPPSPQDHEGARSMGFYNVLHGDASYFNYLADHFAMSDNMHQSIEGGTGANHVALGTGDAVWYSDGKGHAIVPPTLNTEDPDPQAGTNNVYTQDGYSGGTYSNCSDASQPGVHSVVGFLHDMQLDPNCDKGHYYLLNNYAPGYFGDGTVNSNAFAIPPSSVRNIGDALLEKNISWKYYGAHWNRYVNDPNGTDPTDIYCDICNPFQYATSIMANAAVRTSHIKDTLDFYTDVSAGNLPAFSILKPDGLVDGHPASSKLDLFEGFSRKVIEAVQAQPNLWKDTVIFITFDEGGGYYDSGYIQPIDFFGDGTRIPLIAVSPWTTGGYLSHEYADHVSILKFVERNWKLKPLTKRSRDNLPNPVSSNDNPWVPKNGPALTDLVDMFSFGHSGYGG
jgi:phospholipase C